MQGWGGDKQQVVQDWEGDKQQFVGIYMMPVEDVAGQDLDVIHQEPSQVVTVCRHPAPEDLEAGRRYIVSSSSSQLFCNC